MLSAGLTSKIFIMKTEEYFNEGTPFESMKPALSKGAVMLSAIEKMSDEQLNEEQRVLTAEIDSAHERLSSVETEIFYRKNPECRRH